MGANVVHPGNLAGKIEPAIFIGNQTKSGYVYFAEWACTLFAVSTPARGSLESVELNNPMRQTLSRACIYNAAGYTPCRRGRFSRVGAWAWYAFSLARRDRNRSEECQRNKFHSPILRVLSQNGPRLWTAIRL
jgi:hypothetical protein